MSIPVLSAADPVTIPATVYDKVWVEEVVISAPDPNGEVTARVRLRRFAAVEGRAELEPAAGQWLEVRDVRAPILIQTSATWFRHSCCMSRNWVVSTVLSWRRPRSSSAMPGNPSERP